MGSTKLHIYTKWEPTTEVAMTAQPDANTQKRRLGHLNEQSMKVLKSSQISTHLIGGKLGALQYLRREQKHSEAAP